jgi:diazepam-binding inhibitor (GABA receptor modulator, acyl-CoA-binding protein)
LRSYGLFKQVTVGDVNTERPGMFSMVARAKWYFISQCFKVYDDENVIRDAWKECEGMTTEGAEEAYISLVKEVNPDWTA